MAIQLPYTSEDDMMSGVLQRVEQRRYANQQRNDENLRYKDAQARADEAMKYDKEKFDWSKEMAREQMSLDRQRIGAANKQNELQADMQRFQFNQVKTEQHAGEYMGRLFSIAQSPEFTVGGKKFFNIANQALYASNKKVGAFGISGDKQYHFNDKVFESRPFTADKKELFWNEYSADASANGVTPSRKAFETMWGAADANYNQYLGQVVKGWNQKVPADQWKKIVKGPGYESWSNRMNASAADPTQLMPMAGESSGSSGWLGNAVNATLAIGGSIGAYKGLTREIGVPKIASAIKGVSGVVGPFKNFGDIATSNIPKNVSDWISGASPKVVKKMFGEGAVDAAGKFDLNKIINSFKLMDEPTAINAASQLGKSMPKSGAIALIKTMFTHRFSLPVITAVAAATGIYLAGEKMFGDEN